MLWNLWIGEGERAGNLTILGCPDSDNLTLNMEHLACFVPGNLALGVESGAVAGAKAAAYLQLAMDLADACFQMYAQQPSGAHLPLRASRSSMHFTLPRVGRCGGSGDAWMAQGEVEYVGKRSVHATQLTTCGDLLPEVAAAGCGVFLSPSPSSDPGSYCSPM